MINSILPVLIVLVLVALFIYVPRLGTGKQRAMVGLPLLILGIGGLYLGTILDDRQLLQSDAMAYLWVGGFTASMMLGLVLLGSSRRRRGDRN